MGSLHPGKYGKQLFMWLGILSITKMCTVVIMLCGHTPFQAVAEFFLLPVHGNHTMELIVAMIATPVFMNMFQLWVVDNFIRKQETGQETGDDDSGGEIEFEGGM